MSEMQTDIIHVQFHYEDGSWWADSMDLPSLFAGDPDLEEARGLVRQVVRDEVGEATSVVFWMPAPVALAAVVSHGDSGHVKHEPGTWPEPEPVPSLTQIDKPATTSA